MSRSARSLSRVRSFLAAAVAVTALAAAPAYAESWSCTYAGNWTRNSDGGNAPFTWRIQWEKANSGGWRLFGDFQDRSGSSRFDGRCANKSCQFYQRYIGGNLDGKTYHYRGSYTDTWYGDAKTVNAFTGNWGYNPGGTDGGWTATATCTKN